MLSDMSRGPAQKDIIIRVYYYLDNYVSLHKLDLNNSKEPVSIKSISKLLQSHIVVSYVEKS